jgi:hypothetical protein
MQPAKRWPVGAKVLANRTSDPAADGHVPEELVTVYGQFLLAVDSQETFGSGLFLMRSAPSRHEPSGVTRRVRV